jgi:pimeloyl-ACP methyl ester carboxylesterase
MLASPAAPLELPMRSTMLQANGLSFHVRTMGDPTAPLMLFLHGFPEYSGAWDEVMPAFADRFHVAAPDQRGYGPSSKPAGVDAYKIGNLVADTLALAEALSPERPFTLVGHDWGASVAYATAIARPGRVARLVVINGVHPIPMQRALIEDEAQRKASQYMRYFRDGTRADTELAEDGFRRLFAMLERFGPQAWLTPEKKARYLQAWGEPGALPAMLNWYRASAILVPAVGEAVDPAALPRLDPARLRVAMPHLIVWGMDDRALLPASRAGIEALCEDVRIREIANADHWVVHQRTAEVVGHIKELVG